MRVSRQDQVGPECDRRAEDKGIGEPKGTAEPGAQVRGGEGDRPIDGLHAGRKRSDKRIRKGDFVGSVGLGMDHQLGVRGGGQNKVGALSELDDSIARRPVVDICGVKDGDHDAGIDHYRSHSSRNSSRYPGG